MNKIIQLLFFVLSVQLVSAQYCGNNSLPNPPFGNPSGSSVCTPSGMLTQPGFSPTAPLVNNQLSTTVIQFKNFNTIDPGGQTFTVQSLTFDSIGNLPAGTCWASNKSNNLYNNQEDGCIKISGTPCTAPGQYRLKMIVTTDVGVPIQTDASAIGLYYYLRVKNAGDADTPIDTTGQSSGTNTFIPYGPSANCSGAVSVNLGTNQSVCIGTGITLNPIVSGGAAPYTYSWSSSGSSLSCNNCQNPTAIITQNSTFYVTVTDMNNVVAVDNIVYTLSGGCASCTINPAAQTTPGVNPTAENLPCIVRSFSYNETIQARIDTAYDTVMLLGGIPTNVHFRIDSMRMDSVIGLPANIGWIQNPYILRGGGNGCVKISGTTNDPTGRYYITGWGTVWTRMTASVPFIGNIDTPYVYQGQLNSLVPWGDYYVDVINNGGACHVVSVVTVDLGPDYTVCNGATVTLNPVISGGNTPYTYAWSSSGSSLSCNNCPNPTATITQNSTYTVTVTDFDNNTAVASVSISRPSSSVSVNVSTNQTSCFSNTGSATANPTGGTPGYSYSWSNGGSSATISSLAAGPYSVTVTDNTGCTATASATVTSPAAFTLSVSVTNVNCFGQNTGAATANVTGSTGNVTYTWSNTANTASITGVAAGTYFVTVTDGSGCSKTASGTITQPANPLTVSVTATPSACAGSTGSASASVSNNSGAPSYLWNNNATTSTLTNLPVGIYTVTVTAGGCTATSSAAVNNINGPALNILKTDPTCFGSTNGSATAVASGGTPPYTYTWSTGAGGSTLSGVAAGTYTVIVTDNGGCQATNSVFLIQPNAITFNPTVTNVNCNGGQTGSISLSVAGGTGPYAYSWSNGASSSSISNLSSGNFIVTVTDSKSCTAVSISNVSQPAALIVSTSTTGSNGNDGTATVSVSGGTSPYSYTWSNSQNTATATNLAAGQFTVTVYDSKGCSATASASVANATGIEEVLNELTKISLYPNPATEELTINPGNLQVMQVRIYNVDGKLVRDVNQPFNNRMEISELAGGVYIAEIKTKEGSAKRRWVKM